MHNKVRLYTNMHRITINTEGKAKVVAAEWETYLNAALII